MCGIFGYASIIDDGNAAEIIFNGLKRLEYRGYDSWGIAIKNGESIKLGKRVGKLTGAKNFKFPKSGIGIGHTRWATHGKVNVTNAHPHYSSTKDFYLAHNGIVQNYLELKDKLVKDKYPFKTQTDTEVIIALIEKERQRTKSFKSAVRRAFKKLSGRNTIIILTNDNKILAIRNGSPLVVGLGENQIFFASDTLSFADKTDKAIVINNCEMAEWSDDKLSIYELGSGRTIECKPVKFDFTSTKISKEGYDHYIYKEINEQPEVIKTIAHYTKKELDPLIEAIKQSRNVYTVGAGTANFVAGQIAYYLRRIAGVNAIELKAYETAGHKAVFSKKDIIIAVSQSGETADTLEALEFARNKKVKIASIVNMMGSSISRMSDYPYYTKAGPEICVLSTKTCTAKICWGYLLANSIYGRHRRAQQTLELLASRVDEFLSEPLYKQTKGLAKKLLKKEHFFLLGRGQNYYMALEGALKVKEVSYKHFEAFSGGELKHGVIALVEKGTPVLGIVSEDDEKENMLNALAEVKARGAFVVGVAQKESKFFDEFIKVPSQGEAGAVTNLIPFQLIGYYMAVFQGHDPDKPRNLAKSVTVK